jgi:hypothetical protein
MRNHSTSRSDPNSQSTHKLMIILVVMSVISLGNCSRSSTATLLEVKDNLYIYDSNEYLQSSI